MNYLKFLRKVYFLYGLKGVYAIKVSGQKIALLFMQEIALLNI